MKCLMKSWLRPSNSSASVTLPSGASKTYSFSIFTHGSSRRWRLSSSRRRVNSFSFASKARRASIHSSLDTACLFSNDIFILLGKAVRSPAFRRNSFHPRHSRDLHHGTNFNRAQARARNLCGDAHRLVEILRIDQEVTAELLARL